MPSSSACASVFHVLLLLHVCLPYMCCFLCMHIHLPHHAFPSKLSCTQQLLPRKVFLITSIAKTLELVFIHFHPCQFFDLERSGRRGRIGGYRVGNRSKFFFLGKDDPLCLLGTLSCFQASLGATHEDLGSYFILESIDKAFPEEGIGHTLHS
jgi:hypothetical protein